MTNALTHEMLSIVPPQTHPAGIGMRDTEYDATRTYPRCSQLMSCGRAPKIWK